MRNIRLVPMQCVVQSYLDNSGVIQVFGAFKDKETARTAIEELSQMMEQFYCWTIVPIWDVD